MTMLKPRTGMRLTVEEFMELPDTWDKRKLELDEGVLYIMAKPRLVHQFFQSRLSMHFEIYLDQFPEPPADIFADVIVALSLERRILLAPDLTIVLKGNPAVASDRMIEGIPDIVIGILSTDRNRDLIRKRQLYAQVDVPEYWIFDPENDTVTQLQLQNSQYAQRALLTAADTLTTPQLPGLAIPLADIFRHPRRPITAE